MKSQPSRRAVIQASMFLGLAAATGCASIVQEEQLPVVFLHSLAGAPDHWSEQQRALGGRRRTLALSWPGHGDQPLPVGTPSMEALAELTLARLDAGGIKRAIVVGHSAGAGVAIALAKMAPDRVAGLLLVDPAGDLRTLPPEANRSYLESLRSSKYGQRVEEQWSALLKPAREETRQAVLTDLKRTNQSTVIYVMSALMQFDPISPLKNFTGPIMIVTAPGSAVEWPNSLRKRLPHLPVKHLSGVSHWLHMDDPATFNAVMMDLLSRVDAGV